MQEQGESHLAFPFLLAGRLPKPNQPGCVLPLTHRPAVAGATGLQLFPGSVVYPDNE